MARGPDSAGALWPAARTAEIPNVQAERSTAPTLHGSEIGSSRRAVLLLPPARHRSRISPVSALSGGQQQAVDLPGGIGEGFPDGMDAVEPVSAGARRHGRNPEGRGVHCAPAATGQTGRTRGGDAGWPPASRPSFRARAPPATRFETDGRLFLGFGCARPPRPGRARLMPGGCVSS